MGVLLLGADYYGTLAAARSFGAHGIDVIMADEQLAAVGLASRFTTARRRCPPVTDLARFLPWLVEQGQGAREKLVLYPTNDHLAWLLAAHRETLGRWFFLYHPREVTNFTLLDKHRLHLAAQSVGLDSPMTRLASSAEALEDVARTMAFPLLLKPRTQVFLINGVKGVVVESKQALHEKVVNFRRLVTYDPVLEALHPEVREPLVQEYLPEAETGIFSVSGFRSQEGELVTRGAMKVLQRPRKLGIGLCFEARTPEAALVERLGALCEKVGYFGAFEAEFIVVGERRLLIDFNPRFYSQMGFDLARGLDLAMLVYRGARGEAAQVKRLLAEARAWQPSGHEAYCHRGVLELVLRLQGASGRMSTADVRHWRDWLAEHRGHLVDAVWARGDVMPGVLDSARWVEHFARHPRSFVRQYVLNR